MRWCTVHSIANNMFGDAGVHLGVMAVRSMVFRLFVLVHNDLGKFCLGIHKT